ncbi:MAG: helix-hairpin-helix domain-containing protein [Bacteroidetes bacterium]|nr:helix-hairpin-helix domain-containing protein [Bacteroidota bacterium]
MPNQIKKWLLPFFSLNTSEQRGILLLAVIAALLIGFNLVMSFFIQENEKEIPATFIADVDAFKKEQQKINDSLAIVKLQNSGQVSEEIAQQKIKPRPFDPNKLPEEEWLAMGFTPKQVKMIKNYEAKGGKFNKKEDVKKLYCLSEAEYNIIEPFISIASAYKSPEPKADKKTNKSKQAVLLSTEINSADATTIEKNLNVNPWLANRICDYRHLIGGYNRIEQLQEVYGMKPDTYEKIKSWIKIDTSQLNKIDLNTIAFKELLKHPYMDYQTTKAIISTRDKIKKFQNIEEITQIEGVNDTILVKMMPYFYILPQ